MKFLVLILFLANAAWAFDAESYRARRDAFTSVAEEMRKTYESVRAKVSETAQEVSVPLETHENGAVKLSIAAEKAQFFMEDDLVWAQGVVIRQFDEKGVETRRVEAEELVFVRASRRGWAQGAAKVTSGGNIFSGEDVFFSTDDDYILSFKSSSLYAASVGKGVAP